MTDTVAPDSRCPDFELAELIELDPAILVPNDGDVDGNATKELTIQLALAFNDFKLIAWCQSQLLRGKPHADEATAYVGQWAGMNVGLNRLAAGILWEITGVLRKHARILETSTTIRGALARIEELSPGAAKAWGETVCIAHGRTAEGSPVHEFYKEIRNSFAFHYKNGGPALLASYAEHFDDPVKDLAHTRTFVSLGESMERTRFYFADAAAQRALATAQRRIGLRDEQLTDFAMNVNFALRFVVSALLEQLKQK